MPRSLNCFMSAVVLLAAACWAPLAHAQILFDDQFNTGTDIDTTKWEAFDGGIPALIPIITNDVGGEFVSELVADSSGAGLGSSGEFQTIDTFLPPPPGQKLQATVKVRDILGTGSIPDTSIRLAVDIASGGYEMNLTLAHPDRTGGDNQCNGGCDPVGEYWPRFRGSGGVGPTPYNDADHHLPTGFPVPSGDEDFDWVRMTMEDIGSGHVFADFLISDDGVNYTSIGSGTGNAPPAAGMHLLFTVDANFPAEGENAVVAIDFATVEIVQGSFDVPTDISWAVNGSGVWGDSRNWTFGGPPGFNLLGNLDPVAGREHTVIFGDVPISQARGIVNDQDVTVNSITFDNHERYTLGGPGSVSLQSTDDGTLPAITVNQGTHEIQLKVNLLDDTNVDGGSSTLEFNHEIDTGGHLVNMSGAVGINHSLSGGGMVRTSGTLGTAGDTPITADLILDGATLDIEVGDTSTGKSSDRLDVTGNVELNGTVTVNVGDLGSFTPLSDIAILTSTSPISLTGNLAPLGGAGAGSFSGVGLSGDGMSLLLLVGETSFSDFNDDGIWNLPDLNLVLFNWQVNEADLTQDWINSRPDTGMVVGLGQLNQVLFNWQQASSLATVPEPSYLVLTLLGMVGLAARRRFLTCRHVTA